MKMSKTKTWKQYEAGQAYKRRIGLEETVARNERYYRGDQWSDAVGNAARLPHPVFNVIRRVTDYLVGAAAGGNLSVVYTDETGDSHEDAALRQATEEGIALLNRHVAYRWEQCHMDRLTYQLLLDAALTGDGVLYCYCDEQSDSRGAVFGGDIRTMTWHNTDLFAADMNRPDIQSQDYIILAGRESVASLRREAKEAGFDNRTVSRIVSDAARRQSDFGCVTPELEGEDEAKATVLLKFWKEDGVVWYERSTEEVVLARKKTPLRLYPVAYFNWIPTRGGFHGTSPVTGMVPNQRFINRAYAMVMKHMTDTAFSKVVYDKSRIPEWSNEVGEAIGAVGGSLSDAVQVVGVGQMQDGYMELIESAIRTTKEMMGATDTVLGSAQANNTSAILALQEASKTALHSVCTAYLQCIEDVAVIWADMLCARYGGIRRLTFMRGGEECEGVLNLELLRSRLLRAKVEVGNATRYSASVAQTVLEKLLDGGHITTEQYLEMLPEGILPSRGKLLEEIRMGNTPTPEQETTQGKEAAHGRTDESDPCGEHGGSVGKDGKDRSGERGGAGK